MPLTIVPEGIKLQKVNKAEKEAIEEYNNKEIIKTLASSGSAGIAVLAFGTLVAYALYKGVKFPSLDIVQSFATGFPQLSAVLGIKRELTAEQAETLRTILEDPSSTFPWLVNLTKDNERPIDF
jgi:hypothetical protein